MELLVVIAIIGILVALLLPAVQAAREAARRTECKNKLRQMGIALQNHVDTFGFFPTGGIGPNPQIQNFYSGGTDNSGTPNGANRQGIGWAFQILPYLEEGSVRNLEADSGQNLTNLIGGNPIPLYNCPSRRGPTLSGSGFYLMDYASAQPIAESSPQGALALGNFRIDGSGSVGFDTLWPYMSTGLPNVLAREAYWCVAAGNTDADGDDGCVYGGVIVRTPWELTNNATPTTPGRGEKVRGVSSAIKPGQVTDGMSHTMVISEKLVRSDLTDGSTPQQSDDRGWLDGWDPDVVRFAGWPPLPDTDGSVCRNPAFSNPTSTDGPCRGNGVQGTGGVLFFGSAHPAGVNAALADGSVQFINYDVNHALFNATATRNGEEVIDFSEVF